MLKTLWDSSESDPIDPFRNSAQEDIDNVAPGGTIVFKEGSDDWTGTIDKAMTLTSGIGVMVIGR